MRRTTNLPRLGPDAFLEEWALPLHNPILCNCARPMIAKSRRFVVNNKRFAVIERIRRSHHIGA
jgi:hypothetical protein